MSLSIHVVFQTDHPSLCVQRCLCHSVRCVSPWLAWKEGRKEGRKEGGKTLFMNQLLNPNYISMCVRLSIYITYIYIQLYMHVCEGMHYSLARATLEISVCACVCAGSRVLAAEGIEPSRTGGEHANIFIRKKVSIVRHIIGIGNTTVAN